MFLKNFHIFIKKRAVLQQKFTVQVTTLADCDDITRFDGSSQKLTVTGSVTVILATVKAGNVVTFLAQNNFFLRISCR
jgi:hypothetical protein